METCCIFSVSWVGVQIYYPNGNGVEGSGYMRAPTCKPKRDPNTSWLCPTAAAWDCCFFKDSGASVRVTET